MKYRKKPVVIDAYQWLGINDTRLQFTEEVYRIWGHAGRICSSCGKGQQDHAFIETLEGGHIVCPSDFVITGVHGEKYPCKENIFWETYEEVDEVDQMMPLNPS